MPAADRQPPPCAHRMPYRVAYADTDQMGRVYYGNYLTWFERARTELLREVGYAYRRMEEEGAFLPVRHCELRYHGYFVYDDEVVLASWVSRLRGASLSVATAVLAPGEEAWRVAGTVDLACVNARGRPQPLPAPLREAVSDFLAPGPNR